MSGGLAHWYPAYVGLGSNLGRPVRQLESALDRLASLQSTRLVARSAFYRSAPFGGIEQPDFVNAVAALLTQLGPPDLLEALLAIEQQHGRTRDGAHWGPRTLDLDLLAHGSSRLEGPDLTLPHPGIAERNFVLLPLQEVAPELVLPGLGRIACLPVNRQQPRISRID